MRKSLPAHLHPVAVQWRQQQGVQVGTTAADSGSASFPPAFLANPRATIAGAAASAAVRSGSGCMAATELHLQPPQQQKLSMAAVVRSSSCETPRPASCTVPSTDVLVQPRVASIMRVQPQSPLVVVRHLTSTPQSVSRARTLSPTPAAPSPLASGRALSSALHASAGPGPVRLQSQDTATALAEIPVQQQEPRRSQDTATALAEIVARQQDLQGTVEKLCSQMGQVALGFREWQQTGNRGGEPPLQGSAQEPPRQRAAFLPATELFGGAEARGNRMTTSPVEQACSPPEVRGNRMTTSPAAQTCTPPEVSGSPASGGGDEELLPGEEQPRFLRQVVEGLKEQNDRLEAKNNCLEERNRCLEEAMYELLQRVGNLEDRLTQQLPVGPLDAPSTRDTVAVRRRGAGGAPPPSARQTSVPATVGPLGAAEPALKSCLAGVRSAPWDCSGPAATLGMFAAFSGAPEVIAW